MRIIADAFGKKAPGFYARGERRMYGYMKYPKCDYCFVRAVSDLFRKAISCLHLRNIKRKKRKRP